MKTTMNGWEQTQLSNRIQLLVPKNESLVIPPGTQAVIQGAVCDALRTFGKQHELSEVTSFFFMVSFAYGCGRRSGYDTRRMLSKATEVWAQCSREAPVKPVTLFPLMLEVVWGLGRAVGWDDAGMLGYATKAWEACDRALAKQTQGQAVRSGSTIVKP